MIFDSCLFTYFRRNAEMMIDTVVRTEAAWDRLNQQPPIVEALNLPTIKVNWVNRSQTLDSEFEFHFRLVQEEKRRFEF